MHAIDRKVYGDNQFFGINHRSQQKARAQLERFQTLESITAVYEVAVRCGVGAIMLNSNARADSICRWFRNRSADYADINWYPSVPYPHKYANLVTEKGLVGALLEVLWSRNDAVGAADLCRGTLRFLGGRPEAQVMKMLVDLELRPFRGLRVNTVFLQNVVVDLLLGLGMMEVLGEYCSYVRQRYGANPGLITQNLPRLLAALKQNGIRGVVVCASVNKAGYLMSPGIEAYLQALAMNDPKEYQVMAMSVLASGALSPADAFSFVNGLELQSVVFGASSEKNIAECMKLIL